MSEYLTRHAKRIPTINPNATIYRVTTIDMVSGHPHTNQPTKPCAVQWLSRGIFHECAGRDLEHSLQERYSEGHVEKWGETLTFIEISDAFMVVVNGVQMILESSMGPVIDSFMIPVEP